MSIREWILDLSVGTKQDKEAFLTLHVDKNVVMDLTCFDPQDFYARFPQLKGVCATLLSENKRCEAHFRENELEGLALLQAAGWTPVVTNMLVTGFVVPRTIATIVNEAFYSWEEKVATQGDIDRAMCFGVNYPRGPFAWAKGKEKIIVLLLQTLQERTGDRRYQPAKSLLALNA